MARQESDREDLLRDATALVERAEVRCASTGTSVVAGFRRDGSASFYFGSDPMFQFKPDGELRRAYVAGRLIKVECGRLVALTRERSPDAVTLVRSELSDREQTELLQRAQSLLDDLATSLSSGSLELVGQVPPNADVIGRIRHWLANRSGGATVA